MKKVLLVLGALAMVLSGVAMVSAYEAHTVNVTTHVENAINLTPSDRLVYQDWHLGRFGTVFPEEFLIKELQVRFSSSFCQMPDQQRVLHVDYEVWVMQMPQPGGGYYPWLGDALAFSIDGASGLGDGKEWAWVGNAWPPPIKVTSDNLSKEDNVFPFYNSPGWMDDGVDYIRVGLDVPVFREYYNYYTDEKPKPSGKNVPSVIYETDDPRYDPDGDQGITLGASIVIQITKIY
jgi:hypothetical protein